MPANVHVILTWISDGSKPTKPDEYLVEYPSGQHSIVYWDGQMWKNDPFLFAPPTSIVSWAKIPSTKGHEQSGAGSTSAGAVWVPLNNHS